MPNNMILLVDDDPDVKLAMHVLLEAGGYDTCFASDSVSCISEARKQQPNLILLDLGLPGGDGFVVIEALKRHPSLAVIPIIVVSGRDASGNQERALKAGAKVYLQKPVEHTALLAIIRKTLGQPELSKDADVTGTWELLA